MSKLTKIIGDFQMVETVGSVVEFLRKLSVASEITESQCYMINVVAGTVDKFVDFGEVATPAVLYMNLTAGEEILVKVGSPTDTGFTITGLSIITGPVGAIYISVPGVDDVTIDFAVFGS